MKLNDKKMIAFDLFGVLISEGHLISNGLMKLLPENTDKHTVKQQYEAYNEGKISEADFWSGIGHPGQSELREQFLNLFQLDAEFDKVITRLKPHYRLSILSNFPSDWADNLNIKFEFNTCFSPVIFSGHVKCKKPDAKIYQKLLQQSDLDSHQIIFVDDKLENLQTAHTLGLTTIYLKHDKAQYMAQYNAQHSYQPDFCINRLAALIKLLI